MEKEKRRELVAAYKEISPKMGIVQIKNLKNGKVFLAGYPNLKNQWVTLKMQLDFGRFANAELQRDWKEYGADCFSYEVLREEDTKDVSDVRWALKKLLTQYLDEIQPYGEKGYNKEKN